MNSQNSQKPLVPQGSRFTQLSSKRKSNLAVAVFAILAFHAAVLGGLLIQGCKQEAPVSPDNNPGTNATAGLPDGGMPVDAEMGGAIATNTSSSPITSATNAPVGFPPVSSTGASNVAQMPPDLNSVTNAPGITSPGLPRTSDKTVTPVATTSEYKVVSGDMLGKIATRNGVTLKALMDANPNVDPKKLQVGQVLVIPAPEISTGTNKVVSSSTATPASAQPGTDYRDTATGETVYVVVSGDNLTKIAKKYKVKVADLKTENRLASDAIKVGQKLRIPGSTTATPAPSAPATAPVAPTASVPIANVPVAPAVETVPTAAGVTNVTRTAL